MTGWKAILSNISESTFFDLYRHYIGPFSTPYNKSDLVQGMVSFLESDYVIRQSLDYINYEDAFILSCIALQPSLDVIVGIIDAVDTAARIALMDTLSNLEERLLIWREITEDADCFYLTPLSKKAVEAGYLGPGLILGPPGEDVRNTARTWFNDSFLNSLLRFLMEPFPLFRKEGGMRSKSLAELERIFPALFRDSRGEERLSLAIQTLIAMGMVHKQEDGLMADIAGWRQLEAMGPGYRHSLLAACAIAGEQSLETPSVTLVQEFLQSLPAGKFYASENIAKLIRLLDKTARNVQSMLSNMLLLGELVEGKDDTLGRPLPLPENTPPLLTITPVGDISCQPGFPLECDIALMIQPDSCDTAALFHLHKERFFAGLDAGSDRNTFVRKLENYSGRPLPSNIATLLEEWAAEYRAVSIQTAAVLQVEGHLGKIIEETRVLNKLAIAHPAPGIWLLNPDDEQYWRQALVKVGITHVPRISKAVQLHHREELPFPVSLSDSMHLSREIGWEWPELTAQLPQFHCLADSPVFQQFNDVEKKAFLDRLKRRIILSSEQIRPGTWNTDAGTARGLDHQAKINLVESALARRNERLEISFTTGGELKTITIIPQNLEKIDSDHVLTGYSTPDGQFIRHSIRKIVFLRRFKAFLI